MAATIAGTIVVTLSAVIGGVLTPPKAAGAMLSFGVRELRRANAILKSASAFFAAELDRPQK